MRGLDHLVHSVRDLDAARNQYEAAGFTTTPRALHPWGTANSLVQFDRSFIEILSVEEPENIAAPAAGEFSFGRFNQDFLALREGMSMMVFSSDDANADLQRWRADGVQTYEPFGFSRLATLPDGQQVTVSFSLAFATHPHMPRAGWFVCQHHNPEHFWKPHYQRHANGAARMDCVWLQADEPAQYADFLSSLFPDETQIEDDAHGVTLVLEYGKVAVRKPAFLAERFPGMALPPTAEGPAFAAVSIGGDGTGTPRCVNITGLVVLVQEDKDADAAYQIYRETYQQTKDQ